MLPLLPAEIPSCLVATPAASSQFPPPLHNTPPPAPFTLLQSLMLLWPLFSQSSCALLPFLFQDHEAMEKNLLALLGAHTTAMSPVRVVEVDQKFYQLGALKVGRTCPLMFPCRP